VDEEPARALGHVAADEQDAHPEQRPDSEGQAPADVGCEERGIEEHNCPEGTGRGAHPVAAVDDQIDPTSDRAGIQLVDCRVDRRVLAADAGAGEEARSVEVPGRK